MESAVDLPLTRKNTAQPILKKPLFAVPTVLPTDAFLTDATGVRINGCVRYLASQSPDLVLVDINLLCRAPTEMRTNGAADVLSIATGSGTGNMHKILEKTFPIK